MLDRKMILLFTINFLCAVSKEYFSTYANIKSLALSYYNIHDHTSSIIITYYSSFLNLFYLLFAPLLYRIIRKNTLPFIWIASIIVVVGSCRRYFFQDSVAVICLFSLLMGAAYSILLSAQFVLLQNYRNHRIMLFVIFMLILIIPSMLEAHQQSHSFYYGHLKFHIYSLN